VHLIAIKNAISPLGYEHINIHGRYRFHLFENLQKGAMRPLPNPEQLGELNDWLF